MKYIKLYEAFNGKTLVCVDIQPAHKASITFDVESFFNYLNDVIDKYNRVIYLYNGPDLGYENVDEIRDWMVDNGFDENNFKYIEFFEKGYGWFRSCIDGGYSDAITELLRWMRKKNIKCSDKLTDKNWEELKKYNTDIESVREICKDDPLYIPSLMNFLKDVESPIDCVGGGEEECLKEVEVVLNVIDKKYEKIPDWIY